MNEEDFILLKCIKEGSKLRVKIVSPGYYTEANCQFPRDIREEGRMYKVPREDINIALLKNRYFYRIKKGRIITLQEDKELDKEIIRKIIIYTDESITDCAICYDKPKESVLYPCGHFYTCESCSSKIKTCPICRTVITNIINKSEMD